MPAHLSRSSRRSAALALLVGLGCAKPDHEEPSVPEHHQHHEHQHHGGHHRFDDPAAWVEKFESPERTAWQKPDAVLASMALSPDAIVADLGAGTGYFSVRFAAIASKVYAVDLEPSMVEWLAQRAKKENHANLVAVQGSEDDPRLPEPVDVVFMCNVFHHLADPRAYFQKVAASLRPGGRVVIVDFHKDNPDDAPGPPAEMRLRPQDISAHMEAAGFTLVREDLELLEYQYVLEYMTK